MHRLQVVDVDSVIIYWYTDRVCRCLFDDLCGKGGFLLGSRRRKLTEARRKIVVARAGRIVMNCIGID